MARLIAALLRHGDYHQLNHTPSAHQPYSLTALGRQQALDAATKIRDTLEQQGWRLHDEIDCSRLQRAWQTAEIIREQLSAPGQQPLRLHQNDALAERGLGSAANLSVAEIESILEQDPRYCAPPADWKSSSHYCLPLMGAESLMQAGERVAYHLRSRMEQLSIQEPDADTLHLFVGHGAAFRHGAHLLGVLEFQQIALLSMFHAEPVYLEYHADGCWSHIAGDWKQRSTKTSYTD